MNKENLKEQIDYVYEEGTYEDMDTILNPNKNPVFYKHLKNYLQLPVKYAIKHPNWGYFPRLFNSIADIESFAISVDENNLNDTDEKVYFHLTKFQQYSIEAL